MAPYSYYGHTWTRASCRSGPIWWRRTAPDYGWSSHVAPWDWRCIWRRTSENYRTVRSSASTGAGIERRLTATKVVSCRQWRKPSGPAQDVVAAFLSDNQARDGGRPGRRQERRIVIADDVGNNGLAVSGSAPKPAS